MKNLIKNILAYLTIFLLFALPGFCDSTDWSQPTTGTLYSAWAADVKALAKSAGMMSYTGDTNIPTNVLRYNRSTNQIEQYNGSTWDAQLLTNLKDGAVSTTAKLADSTVTSAKIVDGTITGTDIAGSTVSGSNISAFTIASGNMAANSVTTSAITDANVTNAKLADGYGTATVSGGLIACGSASGGGAGTGASYTVIGKTEFFTARYSIDVSSVSGCSSTSSFFMSLNTLGGSGTARSSTQEGSCSCVWYNGSSYKSVGNTCSGGSITVREAAVVASGQYYECSGFVYLT